MKHTLRLISIIIALALSSCESFFGGGEKEFAQSTESFHQAMMVKHQAHAQRMAAFNPNAGGSL